jgi:hypothetical protein
VGWQVEIQLPAGERNSGYHAFDCFADIMPKSKAITIDRGADGGLGFLSLRENMVFSVFIFSLS